MLAPLPATRLETTMPDNHTPEDLRSLFASIAAHNEAMERAGRLTETVTALALGDGTIYPDTECLETPGGGCRACVVFSVVEPHECVECQHEAVQAWAEGSPLACICPEDRCVDDCPMCG